MGCNAAALPSLRVSDSPFARSVIHSRQSLAVSLRPPLSLLFPSLSLSLSENGSRDEGIFCRAASSSPSAPSLRRGGNEAFDPGKAFNLSTEKERYERASFLEQRRKPQATETCFQSGVGGGAGTHGYTQE